MEADDSDGRRADTPEQYPSREIVERVEDQSGQAEMRKKSKVLPREITTEPRIRPVGEREPLAEG